MRKITALILSAGALSALSIYRARQRDDRLMANPGPQSSALVAQPHEMAPDADAEELLDVAVEHTFPASDPISVQSAYKNRA